MTIKIVNHLVHTNDVLVHQVPTKNQGGAIKPLYIVCHDTASGLKDDGDIEWLAHKSPNSSAHFVLSREGNLTQLAPTNVKTWHAGQSKWAGLSMLNGYSIGIEIDNPGRLKQIRPMVYAGVATIDCIKNPELVVGHAVTPAHGEGWWLAYTDAQIKVVTELCRAIVEAYPTIKDIVTHWMIAPGRKFDTNPLFPLEQVKSRVFGGKDPVPAAQAPQLALTVADASVTANSLNLRAAPGDGAILAMLGAGTRIDVQEVAQAGWLRIIVADGPHKGRTGYVSSKFVDQDG